MKSELTVQWEMVAQWGAMIAELPIEEWLDDLRFAESVAPILDPTLYRDYIYSGKREPLLEMLQGALAFKNAIIKARRHAIDNPHLRAVPKDDRSGSQAASPAGDTK